MIFFGFLNFVFFSKFPVILDTCWWKEFLSQSKKFTMVSSLRGVQDFYFWKHDFELWVGMMAWTCAHNYLRVVLGPCAQCCPCKAAGQKMGQKPTARRADHFGGVDREIGWKNDRELCPFKVGAKVASWSILIYGLQFVLSIIYINKLIWKSIGMFLKVSDKIIEKCWRSRDFGNWHLAKMDFWVIMGFWEDKMVNFGPIDFQINMLLNVNVNDG